MDDQQPQGPTPSGPDGSMDSASKATARYVLASGARMGESVEVLVGQQRPDGRANLSLPEHPTRVYQTLAPYSDSKEPGTWHYA